MFFGRYHHLTLPYRVSVTTIANDISVAMILLSWVRFIWHRGHHDGCRMWSKKCLPSRSTWFYLWVS